LIQRANQIKSHLMNMLQTYTYAVKETNDYRCSNVTKIEPENHTQSIKMIKNDNKNKLIKPMSLESGLYRLHVILWLIHLVMFLFSVLCQFWQMFFRRHHLPFFACILSILSSYHSTYGRPIRTHPSPVASQIPQTVVIRYDTIEEINVDSKAEYTA